MLQFVLALAVQFAVEGSAFPTTSKTAWMVPDAFHMEIGMTRKDAEKVIKKYGWQSSPGKYPRQLIVKYDDAKTVNIQFVDDKLQSMRFEYVGFIPDVKLAYEEMLAQLERSLGYKGIRQKGDRTVLLFDLKVPNVMLVLSTSKDDSFGVQGLGFLAVRYYDPSAERIIP
jgi:predicted RNA binding protein YcfA (HicA-like mRNA interferase family)